MLAPILRKNDKLAKTLIYAVSFVVFTAVIILSRVKLNLDLPFDVHIFAAINAGINSAVSLLLLAGMFTATMKKFEAHKKIMLTAIVLSVFFLLSYIAHHLLAGDTRYGDINADGILSEAEKEAAGTTRMIYYIILFTHIPLAGIILPFILFTAYRALIGEYDRHVKLTRITWPVWFYVAITGVIIYVMIRPYY